MGHERDMIGTISFAIAGAIVTFMPGVVLGLLGGQTKETLICGMGGAFVGVILSQIETHTPLSYCMGVGLIVGGIVGANYSALCYWRRLLVAETPS